MSTSGDIAVLQFGSDHRWHWHYLTPSGLSTFAFDASASPVLVGIGADLGQIATKMIPLASMDMTLAAPFSFDSGTKTLSLTGAPSSFGTAAGQNTSAFAAASTALTAAAVNGSGHLILTSAGGSTFDAGYVIGSAGSTGSTGSSGATGSTGATGSVGATGSQGAAGAKGDTGSVGSQGIQGATGSTGAQGSVGATGITGVQGSSGVISVTAPITNSGTSTSAALGLNFGGTTLQYVRGDGSLATFPTNYLTANQSITLSGDITGSGATAITSTLATVVTSGTYSTVTVNAKGLVTSGATFSVNNSPGRSIVTVAAAANGWQVSASQTSLVSYSVSIATTATIGGASTGYVVLESCSTNSATAANWTEIARFTNGQTITLAVALQSVQLIGGVLAGMIPSGYYARLRSVIVSGTPTFSFVSGQEALL